MSERKRRRFGPRDTPQSARVKGSIIEVTSRVGRQVTERYTLTTDEWRALEREHPNPVWWKRDLVARRTPHLDDQSGGYDQADRIRDGQVQAIDAALKEAS